MISDSLSDSAFSSGSDLGGETPDVRRRLLGAGAEGLEEGERRPCCFACGRTFSRGVCVREWFGLVGRGGGVLGGL